MSKYTYQSGFFIQKARLDWEEWQQGRVTWKFREAERDESYVTLHDASRNIWVLLPLKGGMSYFAYGGDRGWSNLYQITVENSTARKSGMQFLHLSDLHILADSSLNRAIEQRLQFIRRTYPNHYLILTGDIIDNEGQVLPGTTLPIGLTQAAMNALVTPPPPLGPLAPHLAKTRQALGHALKLLSPFKGRVYLCPGNHDYGLWGNLYFAEFRQAFDSILATPLLQASGGLPLGTGTTSKRPVLYSVMDGPTKVCLLGIDTAADPYVAGSGAGVATGAVGGAQLTALQQFFLPGTVVPGLGNALGFMTLAFFHHHPWLHTEPALKLLDADKLMAVLHGNVDLILFGHKHLARHYTPAQVPNGGIRHGALASGSSRSETSAFEITISSTSSAPSIRRVPII